MEADRRVKAAFISWRMAECKAEVKALKAALEKAGVRVIVVGELPGEDLLEAVVQGMDEADLFIIMGTETYGRRTKDLFDTRKEMQIIISSRKPYFVFNMNPQHSLMRFKEGATNLVLNLNAVSWERGVGHLSNNPFCLQSQTRQVIHV